MPAFKDLTGKKFGRLMVTSYAGRSRWFCQCDCGEKLVVRGDSLKTGHTQSCGCWHSESVTKRFTTHGDSYTITHRTWVAMNGRCRNPKNASYHLYGGRGVTVCDRWTHSFKAFLDDMGERPTLNHSIDRIDSEKSYEPGNCRWATPNEQARNRRDSFNLTLNGETRNIADWAESFGLSVSCIKSRLRLGWPTLDALTFPVRRGVPKSAR